MKARLLDHLVIQKYNQTYINYKVHTRTYVIVVWLVIFVGTNLVGQNLGFRNFFMVLIFDSGRQILLICYTM